jgi:Dolichyl-phosphate-mannose-protein mannosyltransferase
MTLLKSTRTPYVLLAVLMVITGLLMWFSQRQFTPVTDELANIPAGLNHLCSGRYTDATQPPLLRYLLALPQWIIGVDPLVNDPSADVFWVEYGRHYMFQNRVSWRTILDVSRGVVILLTLVQMGLVFWWSRQLWGAWAGLVAAIFIAFEPNSMAHGQLATLDQGLSVAFLWAVYALWRYLQVPNWKRFWWLHAATAAAFLVKFSALTLFISGAICLFWMRREQPLHLRRFWWTPVIMFVFVGAGYLFQVKTVGEDQQINRPNLNIPIKDRIHTYASQYGMTGEEVLALRVPLYDFWKGFGMQVFHAMFQDKWRKSDTYQYLMGAYADRGWRTYFLWSFALKSTLATLLLILLLAAMRSRDLWQRTIRRDATTVCLLVSPVLLFLICSMGTINIGHRYVQPMYPFVAMGVGYLAVRFGRRMTIVTLVLLAAHVVSSMVVWPHHLSYHHELARSSYYLSDSNIDWGQDLLFVQRDLARPEVQATTAWADLSGIVQPEHLGFAIRRIPPSMDALPAGRHTIYYSINRYLNRSQVYPDGIYPWLQLNYTPTRRVGTSVLVYEVVK